MPFKFSLGLILFFMILTLSFASAQTHPATTRNAELRGQVRFADGRSGMVGIEVSVDQRGGGNNGLVQTDRDGKFQFSQLVPDIYVVTVRATGYSAEPQEIDLRIVSMGYLNFTLKPDSKRGITLDPAGPASVSALDAGAPEGARRDFEHGRDLLTQGKDLEKSLNYFQKAVSAYPQYPSAYLLMGLTHSSLKNWPEAEKAIEKSIDLNKDNAAAYVALGAVKNEQKNYADAEKYLTQAITLSPNSADAHLELGRTYWGLQRWADADQQITKANTLRPNDAAQHILLGNIFLRERNAEGALKQYQEALRVDPTGPWADSARKMIEKIEGALASAKK